MTPVRVIADRRVIAENQNSSQLPGLTARLPSVR